VCSGWYGHRQISAFQKEDYDKRASKKYLESYEVETKECNLWQRISTFSESRGQIHLCRIREPGRDCE
jgi:hypothetical protein